MKKNPFLNAFLAALYIALIVSAINDFAVLHIPDNRILIPMTMLSLFVLSAAIMGFLFVYEPLRLYFENQKPEAVIFFAKTAGFFACFTGLFICALVCTSLA